MAVFDESTGHFFLLLAVVYNLECEGGETLHGRVVTAESAEVHF